MKYAVVRIRTWNVRSINGKEKKIVEDMIKHQIEIIGISEIKMGKRYDENT